MNLLFLGALERGETLEGASVGALGGCFVAVEEGEFVEGFGWPLRGIGLRGVERGFDGVKGALTAPEELAGERQVFNEIARFGSFGGVLLEQVVQERIKIFLALAGND